MRTEIALCLAALCCSQVALIAHTFPRGDIHPVVEVKDGMFLVSFDSRTEGEETHWGTVFTRAGKVVIPRLRLPPRERGRDDSRGRIEVKARSAPGVSAGRLVIEREMDGRVTQRPLPFASPRGMWVSNGTMAHGWIGVTWSPRDTMIGDGSEPVKLMFSTTREAGFSEGTTVLIGHPATIYAFPSASAPFWAAKRWWIAWIRLREGKTDRDAGVDVWETVLTSVLPESGEMAHKVLPGLSSWNTGLSLAAIDGWLCIAWHASVDGSYPGTATIVTAFEKLPE